MLLRRVQHDILAVGIPKVLNGFVSFLIRIYTVRFLEPPGYGALSLGLNCLLLFDALVGWALDIGTIAVVTRNRSCTTPQIQPAEKATIRLKLVMGCLLIALFGLTGEWLGYRFLAGPGGRSFFTVLAAGGTAIVLLRSVQVYFQARLRFHVFGMVDLAHSALRVLLVGGVLYLGTPSAVSILACLAIAPTVIVAGAFVYGNTRAGWRSVRPARTDAREVLRTSAPVLASVGVGTVASRLDVLLLALRSNPAQLGLYGAALTLATIPEVLGTYLAPVFLPRILPACKEGTFFGLFRRFHLLALAAVAAGLAFTLLAGPPVLRLVLPAKYAPSIDLVLILIAGTLAAASFYPLTLNFLMLTRPRTFLIVDSLTFPVLFACYYFFLPAYGAVAAAWITCVHRLVRAGTVQVRAYQLARSHAECGTFPGSVQPL